MKLRWLCYLFPLHEHPIFTPKRPLNEQLPCLNHAVFIQQKMEKSGVCHVGYGHRLVSKPCSLEGSDVMNDAVP